MKKMSQSTSRNVEYSRILVDKETVLDTWCLPWDGSEEDQVKVLSDKIVDQSRWSVIHELIVQIKDKTYRADYSVGATEQQDESPWQYEDEIEFVEVQQVEKVIKVWEPVKNEPIAE